MSINHVKIYHGLCTTFYSMEHKPQFVRGLRDRLQKLGYRADLVEVPHINYFMVEMCDHEVFRGNLKNLRFNLHYTRDVVTQRAIEAVLRASEKLRVARCHLWFGTLISEEMFLRGPHAPVDYWPEDVKVKPYTTSDECAICCDIVPKKRKEDKDTSSKQKLCYSTVK